MPPIQANRDGLNRFSRDASVIAELATYTRNAFRETGIRESRGILPLPDELLVSTWLRYCDTARELSVFETLKQYLVQFQFPVREGISQHPDYRAATLRGGATDQMALATGLELEAPEALEIFIYQSPAGKIPVVVAPSRADFRSIAQALTTRNEPHSLPDSMGAAMINGLNNWDRIRRLQVDWLHQHPHGDWNRYFRQYILPNKSLYQDKLILLSKNAYSGIPASALGLPEEQWITHSLAIRLEHECTHFFTLRYFGCMANHMHDELIADYMGITKAVGKFHAEWFLHFIGLEDYPRYRPGGRLENYVGTPPLSSAAFEALTHLLKAAATQVEIFDHLLGPAHTDLDRTYRLLALAELDLMQIASQEGARQLTACYEQQKALKVA